MKHWHKIYSVCPYYLPPLHSVQWEVCWLQKGHRRGGVQGDKETKEVVATAGHGLVAVGYLIEEVKETFNFVSGTAMPGDTLHHHLASIVLQSQNSSVLTYREAETQ